MLVLIGSRRLAVASLAILIALAATVTVMAQDDSRHRFFGLPGDVTIDGEALASGDVIVALIGDEEIGRATVNPGGIWFLDAEHDGVNSTPCSVAFAVNGIRAERSWETCPSRVQLALRSVDAVDELESDQAEVASDGEAVAPQAAAEAGIPEPPRTGSGGLLVNEGGANWPLTASITAALMLAVSVVAWLVSRRTDGAQ